MHLRDADLLCDLALRQSVEEAQMQDPPLALVECAEARGEHRAVLRDGVLVLFRPERLERVELAVLVASRPAESESEVYARPDSSASSTSSSSTPAALASSGIVGDRPSCTVCSSTIFDSWTLSSWRPRGTRTAQPLSRKWRLISPMMFGVA